ncbi:DeoR/GlpR family DNA-binding transcription regulator [Anaerofustis stercorihominis]|uniref:DeoR/GlpR family DNA-binding transcription regulator n=1 Tax=Anaerofustis stercorihominis TaxID=214853 RepID=UPI00210907A4|nr:DeoR/GlpR family DNA-binding transcription regulator [Anaerofustis stercorihominis]MCQ4794629.1 DeoR/GlpR family DNA-binding transcription regulator [Anaerofustis stercorihominis]
MASKRTMIIYNYIKKKGEVSIKELCELFPDYTQMTIRRDLNSLQENGYIIRTRGGAVLNDNMLREDLTHQHRKVVNKFEKSKIAVKALEYIDKGSCLYMDSGTTVLELAKIIPDEYCFVTTNDPIIALDLQLKNNIDINLTGGSLNKRAVSLAGPIALYSIDKVNIDTAFLSASGFSMDGGFSSLIYNECELKRKVMENANKVIMMIDCKKFDIISPYPFASFKDIDILITNDRPGDEIIYLAEENECMVVY